MKNKQVKQMIVSCCKCHVEWDCLRSRHGEVVFGSRLYPIDVRYQQFKYGIVSLTADQLRGKS